jgi:nitronate monooxygenase
MWKDRRLTQLFGIEHPIIQAPMGGAAVPLLAAAVTNAGGLGSLGTATLPAVERRRQVDELLALTSGPINLNYFVHAEPVVDVVRTARLQARLAAWYAEHGAGKPPAPAVLVPTFDAEALDHLLTVRPAVASFHFGLPKPTDVAAIKAAGIKLIATATTPQEAKALEAGGVDAVIAQGWEAGGHRGTFAPPYDKGQIGTFALVPQVADAVGVPVIAAGGIADGRGIAAALMLGASAVQLGTAFLSCPEANVHPLHRLALTQAERASIVTPAFTGRPARALANRCAADLTDAEADILDFPLQISQMWPLMQATVARGSSEFLPMWTGQAYGLNRTMPAAELVATLAREAMARLASAA